jgi:hypothetical protein
MAKKIPTDDSMKHDSYLHKRDGGSQQEAVIRDRPQSYATRVNGDSKPLSENRREILFPTEPSAIGHKKIDRAIARVMLRRM